METISAEQFKKRYGDEAYNSFGQSSSPKEPGYFQRVGQDLKQIGKNLVSDIKTQANPENTQSPVKTAVALARGGLRTVGATARAAFTPVMEAPGIKQGTEFIGKKLAGTTPMQKFAAWSQKHPEAAKDIQDVLDVASLFGGSKGGKVLETGIKSTAELAGEGLSKVGGTLPEIAQKTAQNFAKATKNTPGEIMTRIVRLTPREATAFEKTAGKSVGDYLTETGNFGNPKEVIAKEAEKFTQSRQMVDGALAKLPGQYRVGPVEDALNIVIEKGQKASSPNVKAGYLPRAQQLLQKSKSEGLSHGEINEVKRLLEQGKLGYNKLTNPEAVEKATNVDSAIRNWQFKKASELGFENLPEMNKQTQVSKFILNKLGDRVIGNQALNNVTLTDWIILAGGNPTAVGGFLTKKFFGSKTIQARIAKLLNQKEVKEMIKPKTFKPAGLLEAPKGPIELPGEGILRGQANIK